MFTSLVFPARANCTKAVLATLATVTFLASFSPQARGQQTATGLTFSSLGSDVVKMGEYNGSTYLLKHVGPGDTGSIFRVASNNPNGAATAVGVIMKGQYFITEPAFKSDFFMAVDGKPASFFMGQSGSSQTPVPIQPGSVPLNSSASSGTVVLKDGMPEVTLTPSGDIVDFKAGGEITIRNAAGQTDAKLTYNGPTGDQSAAKETKRGLGVAGRVAMLGLGNNPNLGVLSPNNYTIDVNLARGRGQSVNTELYSPRVRSEADPVVRAAARTLAALDIVRKTKPDFSIPAENKLRQLVGSPAPSSEMK